MPRAGVPLNFGGTAATGGPGLAANFPTEVQFTRNRNRVYTLSAAAAVDLGNGLVGIPIANHDLRVGDLVTIAGTANYNAAYGVITTSPTQIAIVAAFVAETFAITDTATVARNRTFRSTRITVRARAGSPETVSFSLDNRRTWTTLVAGEVWEEPAAHQRIYLGSPTGAGTYDVSVVGV